MAARGRVGLAPAHVSCVVAGALVSAAHAVAKAAERDSALARTDRRARCGRAALSGASVPAHGAGTAPASKARRARVGRAVDRAGDSAQRRSLHALLRLAQDAARIPRLA